MSSSIYFKIFYLVKLKICKYTYELKFMQVKTMPVKNLKICRLDTEDNITPLLKNIKFGCVKMSKKLPKTDLDQEIIDTIMRINKLMDLNIYLASLRLAGIIIDINKFMKLYNGNRNKLKIIYQNVPGTLSKVNMITTIQSLLDRIDPDVLAIAEPDTQDIDIDWFPYVLFLVKLKMVQI